MNIVENQVHVLHKMSEPDKSSGPSGVIPIAVLNMESNYGCSKLEFKY